MVPTPGGHRTGRGAGAYASAERVTGTPCTGGSPRHVSTENPFRTLFYHIVPQRPSTVVQQHVGVLRGQGGLGECARRGGGSRQAQARLAEGTDAINAQRDRWCTTWRDVWRALSLLQGYFRMAQALIKLDRNIEVTLQRAVAASCMPCRGVPPAVPHWRASFAQARCCCDMGLVLDDANKVSKDQHSYLEGFSQKGS